VNKGSLTRARKVNVSTMTVWGLLELDCTVTNEKGWKGRDL